MPMTDTTASWSASEAAARHAVVEVGRRMWQRELVSANDGNISVHLDENRILCTPTLVSKGAMDARMLAVIDLDGVVLDSGTGPGPSSEMRMHLGVYREDPGVRAVVHAHPPYSTAFAIRGEELTAQLMPEVVVALPHVPLAPYATPSTDAMPESVRPLVLSYRACLLEQHGALTWGADLESAYLTMERLEYSARMLFLLRQLGEVRELDEHKVAGIRAQFGI